MAVVNQYKFKGIDNSTSGSALVPFGAGNPLVNETIIIKSLLVTSAGTPTTLLLLTTVSQLLNQQHLTADVTTELLTQPLIVEGGSAFTVQSAVTQIHLT